MTPTPDSPPAAPLTAEEIAAIQSRFDAYSGRWYRQEATTLATDIALDDVPCLLRSHAALRDRLARAEEREKELRAAIEAELGIYSPRFDEQRQVNARTEKMCRTERVQRLRALLATPTDGAARAGDAAEGGD